MTTPSRNYFIVFDKSLEKKKELLFEINFFYLKSYNQRTTKFSYVKKPFFRGNVIFGLDFKDKIRPLRFLKIQNDDTETPIDPRVFKKFLLDEKNKFLAFSSQTNPDEFSIIRKMLKNFHFDEKRIIYLTFCKSCLETKRFNILPKNLQIKAFNNQILCPECALNIVINQAKNIGLISKGKLNPKLKNFLTHIILKFKNVDKAISSFKVDFDPIKNKDLTLYDVEKNPVVNKKYLNVKVEDLLIPNNFINILKEQSIKTLLPIQAISLDKGLISKKSDQLIMAPTSAGKTLVGELAGISRILNDRHKMLYLVPIVALANVRTEEFKQKYRSLKLKIVKKIGVSLLEALQEDNIDDLIDADIIIGTYEAIDFIMRSTNKEKLGKIGTIIIDEIQTLIDPERGFILDGLIARLKTVFTEAQFLYLSATIGAPDLLAKKLKCILIRYNNRPVPIERHLILCLNENIKHKYIVKLVRHAFFQKSNYGFKGQTIIFTNTRKKCENLTNYIQKKEIKAKAYHSGLTNEERKEIESEFQTQSIAAVVATAALAAGVDFPAKQVIFESLGMGIKILTVAEFEQMLGRAGRLKKHDKGIVYILAEPGKIYSPKMKFTEENIAINLLNGKIKDFELEPDGDRSLTELLAFISVYKQNVHISKINIFYEYLINANYKIDVFLNKLVKYKLVETDNQYSYQPTGLGRAIAKSFLTIEESLEIIDKLKRKTISIMDLVLGLKALKNVYLSKKIIADLSKNVNMKYFSNNFFSASVLSLMNAEYVKKRRKFSQDFIELILKWTNEIFNCQCKDSPYCDCGRLNLERLVLKLRVDEKLSIEQISDYLKENYEIMVFKGDLIDYLENLIYASESIISISNGIANILDSEYEKELLEIPHIIHRIKNP
ncbi:MAG: DEAD/DEAH box helicase [Promethearchaeota archaeon]